MGLASTFGGLFAREEQRHADDASEGIDDLLKVGSSYWKTGDVGLSTPGSEASGYLDQAATLGANPIATDTTQMDASAAQQGALANIYRHLQNAGGPMEAAIAAQQGSDLANTSMGQLRGASEQSANKVIATAASERGANASAATNNTAAQLAESLKALTYKAAVSHANVQSGMAAKAAQNSMYNLQGTTNQALNQAAMAGRSGQFGAGLAQSQTDFGNAQAALQAGTGILSNGISTGIDAFAPSASASAVPTTVTGSNANYTSTHDTISGSSGYALPSVSRTAYVNPITGDTNNASVPVAANNWASWLSPSEGLNV